MHPAPAGLVAWWKAEGNANDYIGGNNGVAPIGATFAAGKVGQAFSFDGVDDSVIVGDHASLQPVTMSTAFWINLDQLPAIGTTDVVLSKYAAWRGWTAIIAANGLPVFRVHRPDLSDPNGGVGIDTTSSVPMPIGAWTHIACSYDGATARIYVNGKLCGSTAFAGYEPSPGSLRIGAASWYEGEFIDGQLDDVQFFNRALTLREIQLLAVDNPTPTEGLCEPTSYIVTNTNDSGLGSLRQAITYANAHPAPRSCLTFPMTATTFSMAKSSPSYQRARYLP